MKALLHSALFASPLFFTINAAEKPNVIIIFNDDQGYQDLGCYGSPNISTPRIDQLAKEGMRYTDFCVASSVSSASRVALLTGCYPQRVGVMGVLSASSTAGLKPENVTIAEMLKSVSYTTAAMENWSCNRQNTCRPI